MKRSLATILFASALFSLASPVFAQEATLYFMNSLPQVTYSNPAMQPRYKFSLGLPGSSVYAHVGNNGFKYNDFALKRGDSVVADLDKLSGALRKKNYITTIVQADLFRFSMKVNARMYFTWNITAKGYNREMIPKDMVSIFVDGTSTLLNTSKDLSPQVEALAYVESGWGASYIVDQKLTVGAKFKLLKGIGNITTVGSNVTLSQNEDYYITAVADVNARTSGIHQLEDDDNFDFEDDYDVYKKNTGFAFDLGATYKLNDRLTLGASLIDIGSITWKNDTYAYRLDPAKANVTVKGADLQNVLDGDEDYFDYISDSVDANFDFEKTAIGSYKTPLPGKMYLSASYALRRTVTLNGLLFAEKFRGRFAPGISASLVKEFGRRLSTAISYTVTNNSFNNLGAGVSLNLAPFQLYVVGDNLLRAPIALAANGDLNSYLNSSQVVNVRAGLNFVFGWDKTQEKLPYPKKN